MQNLQNLWYKLTVTHADNVDEARREYMTKVILVILNMVGLLFLLVFAINWLVGTTSPTSLIVAVVMETLLGVSWWLAHSGYWRITSYLPPLMFLLLAGQLNYRYGLGAVAMLQYAIAVLLTAMLQGRSAQWITVILGIGAYLGIGSMHVQGRLSPLAVPETSFFEWAMPFSGMLVFIAILQWFYTTQFQQTVARSNAYAAEVIAANNRLEQEIIERKQVEEESIRLQQEIIQAQQRAIQELSTPVIPVIEGVIVLPLIGSIDSMRTRDITRNLLTGITRHRAKVVILDITGVPIIDSGVAGHLNKTIQAARLKGARVMVTGISDAVAETIVDLGIDWDRVETLANLQTGLMVALRSLGVG